MRGTNSGLSNATLPDVKLLQDIMSTDVNVYVYSTSNLLFLAGSA